MKIYIDDYNILVIVVLPKTIRVDLPIKVKKSLKHEIKFIINLNESFAEYAIKNELANYFSNMDMNIGMNIKKKLFTKKFNLIIKQCYLIV